MIVVDSSAVVAIVLGESDAESLLARLAGEVAVMSAANVLEATMVVESRQGADATRDAELLIAEAIDEVVAVDHEHARAALEAWCRFGKGRHLAGLNYGDCLAYATARLRGAPLLFKGDDFTRTDIQIVQV